MILGMSIQAFTDLHVIISLIAIASGLIVLLGMLGSHRMAGWTALFLLTTILTSVTGFLFPIKGFTPALAVGTVSIVILAIALIALYGKHLAGAWRWIYVVTAADRALVQRLRSDRAVVREDVVAESARAAGRSTVLRAAEYPFVIAQTVALVVLLVLGLIAAFKFRPVQLSA